jgi:transcriptional regulator with XRE-family HTH domain
MGMTPDSTGDTVRPREIEVALLHNPGALRFVQQGDVTSFEHFDALPTETACRQWQVPLHSHHDQHSQTDAHQGVTLDEFLAEELQDPEVRAEYEEAKPQVGLAVQALRLRLARGMTQQQLAAAMGTKQSVISRFERGATSPSTRFLHRLARALGAELLVELSDTGSALAARDDLIEATCGMLGHLGPMTPALLEERRRDLEREERQAGCPPRRK